MSKLTLHVNEELITAAKEEAAARHTSVSKLVSDFFRALSARPTQERMTALPPVTASLVGCVPGADDDKNDYIDYLERKHL